MLIAQGPSREAMIKSPVYRAMETGTIARLEEISRCASEVQDALISILSEKADRRAGTLAGASGAERIFRDRHGQYQG